MRVTFDVYGKTADELFDQARERLEQFDPEAEWEFNIVAVDRRASSLGPSKDGTWHGKVDATNPIYGTAGPTLVERLADAMRKPIEETP